MSDIELADCLEEVLRAWKAGEAIDAARLRTVFPELGSESKVFDFFVGLCRVADDWKSPLGGAEKPDTFDGSMLNTPSVSEAPALPSSSTFGRYEIRSRVAAGGMGTVYRAYDPTLGRIVALKVPHLDPEHPRFEPLAEQFVQEARLAASVDHPNVCTVHDAGRHEGTPFVVMAYIEGETLATRLKTIRRYENVNDAVAIVQQIAAGLAVAHRLRIVHRDVKPGNILLQASDGRPLLTDFGLARVAQDGGSVTRPGVVAGTVAYMAPEQAAGQSHVVGPATDVYALGVVLYQMLTGRRPFEGDLPTMLMKIRESKPEPASHYRPDLNPQIEAVVVKAMSHDPKERYPDAGVMADALARLSMTTNDCPPTVSYIAVQPSVRHRRRWLTIGLGTLVTMALLTVGALALKNLSGYAPALDGELVVRVSTDPKKLQLDPLPRPKVNVSVDEQSREALPVRNIDLVTIEVRLNRPAYAYLLWFPGEGGAPSPLFPWDPHPTRGFRVAPQQQPVSVLRSPSDEGKGWPIIGPSGLETAVLLARDTPLSEDELRELQLHLGTLPPTPLGPDLQECAWLDPISTRGTLRGINTGDARDRVDEPVFDLLRRLKPKFALVKAVRFAHHGKAPGQKGGE